VVKGELQEHDVSCTKLKSRYEHLFIIPCASQSCIIRFQKGKKEKLILYVSEFPALFNKADVHYRRRSVTDAAWATVASQHPLPTPNSLVSFGASTLAPLALGPLLASTSRSATTLFYYLHQMKLYYSGLCDYCGKTEILGHFLINCTGNGVARNIKDACKIL